MTMKLVVVAAAAALATVALADDTATPAGQTTHDQMHQQADMPKQPATTPGTAHDTAQPGAMGDHAHHGKAQEAAGAAKPQAPHQHMGAGGHGHADAANKAAMGAAMGGGPNGGAGGAKGPGMMGAGTGSGMMGGGTMDMNSPAMQQQMQGMHPGGMMGGTSGGMKPGGMMPSGTTTGGTTGSTTMPGGTSGTGTMTGTGK